MFSGGNLKAEGRSNCSVLINLPVQSSERNKQVVFGREVNISLLLAETKR
jgi:hypothetical protein